VVRISHTFLGVVKISRLAGKINVRKWKKSAMYLGMVKQHPTLVVQ
jgi:hypothetical protein